MSRWLLLAIVILSTGCEGGREGLVKTRSIDETEVKAEIANLAAYAQAAQEVEASVRYDKAKTSLTNRGPAIQYLLIDTLRTSTDWAVRYGAIEVLDSVGTVTCIDPLIAALLDQNDLVAMKAAFTLQAVGNHQVIPDKGTSPEGLPALPPANPLEEDSDFKIWQTWRRTNGQRLHEIWTQWWGAEKNKKPADRQKTE